MAPGNRGTHWDPEDHLLVTIIKLHFWKPVQSIWGVGWESEDEKRPYLGMLLGGFMQDQGVTVWYRCSPRVLESHPLVSLVTSQGGCLNVLEE